MGILAESGAEHLLAKLTSDRRLSQDLQARCSRRLRELAFLVDPPRALEASLLRLSSAGRALDPGEWDSLWPSAWVEEQIDLAVGDILAEDELAEAGGVVAEDVWRSPHAFLMHVFGIEGRLARTSAVRFNGLPDRVRRTFLSLVVDGQPASEAAAHSPDLRSVIERDVRTALEALFLLPVRHASGTCEGTHE